MAFEIIAPIKPVDDVVEKALAAGRTVRMKKRSDDDPVTFKRKHERERITAIVTELRQYLNTIEKQFPSVNELSEFYRELLKLTVPVDDVRLHLGKIKASKKVVAELGKRFKGKLASATTIPQIKKTMQACIGRISSVIKRLEKDFQQLDKARRALQKLPTIKKQFTVCIAGFPNVGKTTLLTRLTESKAEVNDYAFTTKRLNIGYHRIEHKKMQLIDTPGTLNRDKMNAIELHAHLALKYVADVILYVFDPTFTYSVEKQEALYETMQEYGKPVHVYVSKTDIASQEAQDYFFKKYSVTKPEEIEELLRNFIA